MFLRTFLASLSVYLFSSHAYAAPLLAQATARERGQVNSEINIEDIDGEKAPELQKPSIYNHSFEIRPTLRPQKGEFHTENNVQLSLKLTEMTSLSYVQYFNTNLYNPENKKIILRQPNLVWQDGYARVKFANVWQSKDKNTSFSMQERLFLPVASAGDNYPSRINQGMITIFRSYFSIHQKYFDFVELDLAYAPSFFIFKKSGYSTAEKDVANPVFEHLVNQSTDIKITKSLLFTLPWVFRMTKHRDYSEKASQNNGWRYSLTMVPELDWALTPRHTIGAAFESTSILKADLTAATWKSAFTEGTVQCLWTFKF